MFWIIPYSLPAWVGPIHLAIAICCLLPVLYEVLEGNDWQHWGANAARRHSEAAPRGAAPRAPQIGRRLGGGTNDASRDPNDPTLADGGGGGSAGRSFHAMQEDERAKRRAATDRKAIRTARRTSSRRSRRRGG